MTIKLILKLADFINGVDLTGRRVGEVFELPTRQAELLIAEGWAVRSSETPSGSDRDSGGHKREALGLA